jgi:hypothetical protein
MTTVARRLAKNSLMGARKLNLYFDEYFSELRFKSSRPVFFNLDLHISVMRDLQQEIISKKMRSIRWSISGSNTFSRKIYRISDPVEVINSQTWANLDDELIAKFGIRYRKFLSKFDGFIVTHTPSFAELYRDFNKPILVINSTRYEAPYTNDEKKWKKLDRYLIEGVKEQNIMIASNNLGDADYLKYKTGIDSRVVPSLCEYTNVIWKFGGTKKVVVSQSPELDDFIERITDGEWLGVRKVMGDNYKWNQYLDVREVLYLPYNISTMSLFELATAGVPVCVPTKKFLIDLAQRFSGILSELSYFQIRKLSVDNLAKDDPNNFMSPQFLEWWLDRADFYNTDLMPNVRTISSFEELAKTKFKNVEQFADFSELLTNRNLSLRSQRSAMLASFASMV